MNRADAADSQSYGGDLPETTPILEVYLENEIVKKIAASEESPLLRP